MKNTVKEVRTQMNGMTKRMDDKFCCYGTYNGRLFKCLIKCRDKEQCEAETKIRKCIKYGNIKEENQNGENNER